jgi:hypothetical protein
MLAFLVPSLSAQVNTEKYRNYDGELGLKGLIELNLDIETGNVEFQKVFYEVGFAVNSESYYSFLVGQGDFKWEGGRQFSNEALWHLRFVKPVKEKIELEVFLQYNRNLARLLTFRGLIGSGVRYLIYSEEQSFFWTGVAYMFEREIFEVDTEEQAELFKNSHRASFQISMHIPINVTTVFNTVFYYQPRITDWSDYQVLNESSLLFNLWKALNFGVSFKLRYDTSPPRPDIKSLDTKTLMGIVVKL